MTDSSIRMLSNDTFPPLLKEISDPPKQLYIRGMLPSSEYVYLCVVGSRRFSQYGKDVCEHLISGLAGYPIVIVSGLALGIDSIAHKTALRANIPTIAVPGSGLDEQVLYPRSHIGLARDIVRSGGALVSEFAIDTPATTWNFPQRNRIMAGMCHATLIIEAQEKSGTLITARLAMEYNRDVLVIPGSIFSDYVRGSHRLLREGAQLVTTSEDILEALKIKPKNEEQTSKIFDLSDDEQNIIQILSKPMSRAELVYVLQISHEKASILISTLEIKGLLKERLGKLYASGHRT